MAEDGTEQAGIDPRPRADIVRRLQVRHDPDPAAHAPDRGEPRRQVELPAGSSRPSNNNLYNRPQTKDRVASSDKMPSKGGGTGGRGSASARPAGKASNDASLKNQKAYADRDGNVHRQTGNNQWETRQNNSWNKNSASANANRQQLNRDQQARDRGASRQQMSSGASSRQTRSAPTRSAPARSGGGGRRR